MPCHSVSTLSGEGQTTDALRALRSQLAGKPVEPAVKPTHVVDPDEDHGPVKKPHMRVRGTRKHDGMVSWFLAKV